MNSNCKFRQDRNGKPYCIGLKECYCVKENKKCKFYKVSTEAGKEIDEQIEKAGSNLELKRMLLELKQLKGCD